jgi:UDP-N-acetylmuramoyl-L-alanyl-D-glutamate--2,6-diaminopimelate ligase
MIDDGCEACVMEVSSHALSQNRTFGISFECAVFTNLSQDHLDYHDSVEHYFLAKKKLFDELGADAHAIINADDKYSDRIVANTKAKITRYGQSSDCDIRYEVIHQDFDGLDLEVNGRRGKFNLTGEFNASNLACTYAIATRLGRSEDTAFQLLLQSERIPGRFESIKTDDGRLVIVDYAHTPDALEKILHAVNQVRTPPGKIWTVFGCGGDRDKLKRSVMATVAESLSDLVVVTSDNPRTEDPEQIMKDIASGFSTAASVTQIVDREEAISHAASNSMPGDIIVIAGKGSETYQVIGNTKIDFDDREKVRKHFPV